MLSTVTKSPQHCLVYRFCKVFDLYKEIVSNFELGNSLLPFTQLDPLDYSLNGWVYALVFTVMLDS